MEYITLFTNYCSRCGDLPFTQLRYQQEGDALDALVKNVHCFTNVYLPVVMDPMCISAKPDPYLLHGHGRPLVSLQWAQCAKRSFTFYRCDWQCIQNRQQRV